MYSLFFDTKQPTDVVYGYRPTAPMDLGFTQLRVYQVPYASGERVSIDTT